jgi:hypothetical protein
MVCRRGHADEKILAHLLTEHGVVEVLEMHAAICLERANQANVAKHPEHSAVWKCNHLELAMTSSSLYNPRLTA